MYRPIRRPICMYIHMVEGGGGERGGGCPPLPTALLHVYMYVY